MMRIKKIKPMFNHIVTTAEKHMKDQMNGSLILAKKGTLKEHQTVLAVGSAVRDIKEGDVVKINPSAYMIKQYDPNSVKEDMGLNKVIKYNIPIITVDDEECMLLYDRDVDYVVLESDEVGAYSGKPLIVPDNKILVN